jgi:hypothetical protein
MQGRRGPDETDGAAEAAGAAARAVGAPGAGSAVEPDAEPDFGVAARARVVEEEAARPAVAMPAGAPAAAMPAKEVVAAESRPAEPEAAAATLVAADIVAIPAAGELVLQAPAPGAGSMDTLSLTAVHLSRNAGKPS